MELRSHRLLEYAVVKGTSGVCYTRIKNRNIDLPDVSISDAKVTRVVRSFFLPDLPPFFRAPADPSFTSGWTFFTFPGFVCNTSFPSWLAGCVFFGLPLLLAATPSSSWVANCFFLGRPRGFFVTGVGGGLSGTDGDFLFRRERLPV